MVILLCLSCTSKSWSNPHLVHCEPEDDGCGEGGLKFWPCRIGPSFSVAAAAGRTSVFNDGGDVLPREVLSGLNGVEQEMHETIIQYGFQFKADAKPMNNALGN